MVQTRRSKVSDRPTTQPAQGNSSILPPLSGKNSRVSTGTKTNSTNGVGKVFSKRTPSFSPAMPTSQPKAPLASSYTKPPRTISSKIDLSASKNVEMTGQDSIVTNCNQTNEKRHFLKGFNFDSCQNLLSIPDPPSPQTRKSKSRRRQSTSLLDSSSSPLPFKDVTNDDSISSSAHSGSSINNAVKVQSKKKRQSLCHVPSPDVQEPPKKKQSSEKFDELQAKSISETTAMGYEPSLKNESSPTKSGEKALPTESTFSDEQRALPKQEEPQKKIAERLQHQNWGLGDSEQANDCRKKSSVRRKSKRRQSILLPSENELEELSSSSFSQTTAPFGTGRNDETETETSTSDFFKIQKLVRAYCSLPEEAAARREQADRIRNMTGYSLPGPEIATNRNFSSDDDMVRSQRRDLLVKIGPVMQLMEEQKIAQKEHAEKITNCTVEKTRSGKYRYRDPSGEKIRPEDYKNRYLKMLDKQKWEKAEALKLSLRQLESCVQGLAYEGASGLQSCPGKETKSSFEDSIAPQSEELDDMDITNCSCDLGEIGLASIHSPLLLPDQTATDPGHVRSASNNSPASSANERSRLFHDADKHNDGAAAMMNGDEITENESKLSNEKASMGVKTDKKETDATEDSPTEKGKAKTESPNEEDLVLPIPSRDGESADPEIAKAESKLWESIDRALEIYSSEVLEIQARRRAEHAERRTANSSSANF